MEMAAKRQTLFNGLHYWSVDGAIPNV